MLKSLLIWGLAWLSFPAPAQEPYKQPYNRLQYGSYRWKVFHTPAFHIYFPEGYDSLCAFVADEFPAASGLVRFKTGISPKDAPNIIIYPSFNRLYESNIGSFETWSRTIPSVVLKGNRMLIVYNGSYKNLKDQLTEAMVRSVWEEQFQNNLNNQVRGVVAEEKLPDWFKEGGIRYFAHGWRIEDEDRLRDVFEGNRISGWQQVSDLNPSLAGAAFCYFLSQRYYPHAVMQLFFQLKKKKSLPRAIRLIAKRPKDSVFQECLDFYKKRFSPVNQPEAPAEQIIRIPHGKGVVGEVRLSPDGSACAYVLSGYYKRTVFLYDLKAKKQTRLVSYHLPPWIKEHRQDQYPVIGWYGNGARLLVAMPEKGKVRIQEYRADGVREQEYTLPGVDGISALELYDPDTLLLAANRKGQSDIVFYSRKKERYKPLTGDAFDDSEPVFDKQTGQIVFVSERRARETGEQETVVQGIFSVKDSKALATDSLSYARWEKPAFTEEGEWLAASTRNGAAQFFLLSQDKEPVALSSFRPYSLSRNGRKISFFKTENDSISIIRYVTKDWIHSSRAAGVSVYPWLSDYRKAAKERAEEDSVLKAAQDSEPGFLGAVLSPESGKRKAGEEKSRYLQTLKYDAGKIQPYVLQLYSAYFTARLNNDYFINRYQPYRNYLGQFKFPEPGAMARGGFTDLFENHHFSVAYRMPAGTEGSDFFVKYENTARRTNWSLLWFRKVESLKPDPLRNWEDEKGNPYPAAAKVKTHYYELSLNYPFSYCLDFSLSTAFRKDRTLFPATEKYSLQFEDLNNSWSVSTLTGDFNKLVPTLPFLYKGFRIKLLLDFFKESGRNGDAVLAAGTDMGYALPLYRFITLSGRMQAGYSGGNYLLYNMGGVDNNLTIRKDSSVHFQQDAPYAFQTLIAPLRGYVQNSLYGNQYALINTDVYFPVFETLIPLETPLSFINHLQPGLFADLAYGKETWKAAGQGKWLSSFGFSARSVLAGYPLRVDLAWPGSFDQKPVWYLSLSLR